MGNANAANAGGKDLPAVVSNKITFRNQRLSIQE